MRTASTSERPNKVDAKRAIARFETVRTNLRKIGDDITDTQRGTFHAELLAVLPTIREHNPDMGKKVRRTLRSLGHFISRDGYVSKASKRKANAKRERKAKVSAESTPTIENVNANDTNV